MLENNYIFYKIFYYVSLSVQLHDTQSCLQNVPKSSNKPIAKYITTKPTQFIYNNSANETTTL